MRYHTSSSSLRDSRSRFLGLECASSDECVLPKKRITHVRFLKKTSFSFLKSRLKKADISWIFPPLKAAVRIIPDCLLSSQRVYIYCTHAHRGSVCAREATREDGKKCASLLYSRKVFLAKTRARILYLIWHLFNRREETKESRVISNSKKELQLSRSMAREAVMRRGSAQQVRFYCSRAFLLRSSRKRADEMRERQRWFKTSGSCHPICQSKCPFKNLRSERKKINTKGF